MFVSIGAAITVILGRNTFHEGGQVNRYSQLRMPLRTSCYNANELHWNEMFTP